MAAANPMLELIDKIGLSKLMTLKKYAAYKSNDINHLVVSDIAQVLGFTPSANVVSNLTDRIKTDNPNSLFDWISEPENLTHIVGVLDNTQGRADLEGPALSMCPLCNGVYESHI